MPQRLKEAGISYGKNGKYNYKNYKNAKGQKVPGMYAQDGKESKLNLLEGNNARINELQAKSDSIHNLLSGPHENYPVSQNYSNKYEEGELDSALTMDEIYETNPWYEGDGPIDPLNMTEEEMSEFDDSDNYSWNPSKRGTSSPKINSYREMKEYDAEIDRLKASQLPTQRKGGSTGRGPNGVL